MKRTVMFGTVLLALTVALAYLISVSIHSYADAPLNLNCTLIVPAHPLSAQGLATPYQLQATDPNAGPCNEANPNQGSFVQGAIFDPANAQISIYNPLVVDAGTQPAIAPVVPVLPKGAVVALWFGSNANNVTLAGDTRQGNCVGGLNGSVFGQFGYCNAVDFFFRADIALRSGRLHVPALGTGLDGKTCPTVRDFSIVDQDQSDNVTTTYLVNANGQTAQNTAANAAALPNALANASDNRLLTKVDAALGCAPLLAPDLANNGALVPALPLNELSALVNQQTPVALVPDGDPMVLVNGKPNVFKRDLYRLGVDQNLFASGNTTTYCTNIYNIASNRIFLDRQFTQGKGSPMADVGNNLFTFLAARLNMTWANLGCQALTGKASPVTVTTDGNGVATDATNNVPQA